MHSDSSIESSILCSSRKKLNYHMISNINVYNDHSRNVLSNNNINLIGRFGGTNNSDSKIRKSKLNIYFQNVNRIRSKTNELFNNSCTCNYDVILLVETNFDEEIFNEEIFSQDYVVYRNDRSSNNSNKKSGGGILIALKRKFKCQLLEVNYNIEHLAILIDLNGNKFYISNSYIPPNQDKSVYAEHINTIMQTVCKFDSETIVFILGDFNLPKVKWIINEDEDDPDNYLIPTNLSSETEFEFIDTLSNENLLQINYITNDHGNILDLIFTNGYEFCNLIPASLPLLREEVKYHRALEIVCDINVSCDAYDDCNSPSYCFYRSNFSAMNDFLAEVNWEGELCPINDLEQSIKKFYNILNDIIEKTVPKTIKKNFSGPPWFNKELASLRNSRNRAHNRFKKSNDPVHYKEFSSIRKTFDSLNEIAYRKYIIDIQEEIASSSKRFFNYVNKKRKSTGFPKTMSYKGKSMSDHDSISNAFKELFKNNFATTLSNSFNKIDLDKVTYATTDINLPQFSETDIFDAIQQCKLSFVPGPDGIPSVILKNCGDSMVSILTILFNQSLKLSFCPQIWKTSYIIPIFKKGNRANIEDYRGVTIQSIFFKLLDSLVTNYIRNKSFNVINDFQHGFVSKRSTNTNLMTYTSFLINSMENGLQIDSIYTDFTKAFDRVNIHILCYKLNKIGLHIDLVNWIFSCLSDRIQYVRFCETESGKFLVNSGIQQGSHSGPLYFILFINDIYTIFNAETFVLLFADDAKIYRVIKNMEDTNILQADLNKFSKWCSTNDLPLNVQKCKKISFHRHKRPISSHYQINDNALVEVSEVDDLGVMFDRKVTFNKHIDISISKCNKMLGFVKRNSKDFDLNTLRLLYCTLIRPKIEYCAIIWNPFYESQLSRIENIQARFTRFALRNESSLSRQERNSKLDLDTLRNRRTAQSALFIFDLINNGIECNDLVSRLNYRVPYRDFRGFRLLGVPQHHTNYGQHEPFTNVCNIFNNFHDIFDFHLSRNQFKALVYERLRNG